MKAKWYRRVGGKHVKFNLSKSGITTSFKLGPITINPQRNTYFIRTGIPGLSLRGKLYEENKEAEQNESKIELQRVDKGIPVFEIFVIAFFILMILCWISKIKKRKIVYTINSTFIFYIKNDIKKLMFKTVLIGVWAVYINGSWAW